MSNKNILNALLLFIVTGLASFIYLTEEESNTLSLLTDIDKSTIKTITIHHNSNATTLNKDPENHWGIISPANIAANNFRVKSILKLINAPVHNRYTSAEINLNNIGLENPETTITFDNNIISFGVINPATNLRYVLFKEAIYTIQDIYYPLISSHFSTLVSLNLLTQNSKVEKLILLNQTIAKNNNGLWQSNITISTDNIVKTIDLWQTSQAFGVHQYLERESLGEVFVYTNKQQPVTYLITDTEPWLIIARPEIGLEYHLDADAYKQLMKPK